MVVASLESGESGTKLGTKTKEQIEGAAEGLWDSNEQKK